MQNKGFVVTFAIALALVCAFYLSFSFVTMTYDNKAIDYATEYAEANSNGNTELFQELYNKQYNHYLDSMSTERVFLAFSYETKKDGIPVQKEYGYTLKECREREIGLGLDLKGGMSVIVEVDVAAVLKSLGDGENEAFAKAIEEATSENRKGTNRDYITIFVDKFQKANGVDKLSGVFSTKLKDQIVAGDRDDKVVQVLRTELEGIADNSFSILRTRIDRFGVVAPNIQKLDNRAERIQIELPGIKEPERVKKLLQGSANLEFWKTYKQQDVQPFIMELDRKTTEALQANIADSLTTDSTKAIVNDLGFNKTLSQHFLYPGNMSTVGVVHRNDTAAVNRILEKYKDLYPSDMKFAWAFKAQDIRETMISLHALRGSGVKKGPALDGEVVVDAKADQSQRGTAWEVSMRMNSTGTQRWSHITGEEKGNAIAIVLDGFVYSAPNVNQQIDGGQSSISGDFTPEEAKDLENVLKSGKMKAGVHIVQEDIVGPSLGQEAIDAGVISFALALVLLMIYICLAYGIIPGLVASSALIINLFFTLGTLAAFGAVMTLPGITGLVLSLAMAVDANVLIYERTREELRAGKNVKTALADGYKNAFSAIFDANVTQILTGIILVYFGTGAVRGFATTLIIGIIASFITAVFLTRIFYEFMIDKGYFRNLTFTTAITKNLFVNAKYNFLAHANKFFIGSIVLVVLGIGSLFINSLNYGIDFTGGRNYLIRFENTVATEDVRNALTAEFEGSNITVLTSGSATATSESSQMRITTNYKVENASDETEAEIRGKMTTALKPFLAEGETFDNVVQSSQRVGPSVADDLKTAASIAVVLAIIAMALYILLRFRDVAFSAGTFIAVAHDAAIVIFLYSLLYKLMPFSMEIDQAFIAAILTVVGYSINDKVVIFDRIREIRKNYPKRDVTETINEALNSTLGRTLNTSLSTMLVIFCIFLLGGDTIRSFTFAIFIGVFVGTYSSLFIATPVAWRMLKKKQDKEDKK